LNAIGNTAQFGPPNGYFPLDLFKYTAAGGTGGRTGEDAERTFEGTVAGYFSADGGVTKGYAFNTHADGDFGDWAQSVKADSFLAFSSTGLINAVSATDIEVMDVLGWNAASVSNAGPAGPASDGGSGDVRSGFARHEAPHLDRASLVPVSPDPHHAASGAAHLGRGYDGIDWYL
jgi:hypothetical protein